MRAQADAESVKLRAQAEVERIEVTGKAEASKILDIGKSTAEAYELAVSALGSDSFTRLKVIEEIAKGNIKIIPEILISGSNSESGGVAGLMGLKMIEILSGKKETDQDAK